MRVHDGLRYHAYAAVGRLVMSCQVRNLCPSSQRYAEEVTSRAEVLRDGTIR